MVPWSSIFGQTAPKGAVPPKPGKVLDFKLSCFMNFILCSPFVSSFVSSAIILLQCYDPYEKSNFHVVNCTMGPQQLIKKFSSPFSCHAIFMTLSMCPRCEPWDQIAKQYRSLSLSLFSSLSFSLILTKLPSVPTIWALLTTQSQYANMPARRPTASASKIMHLPLLRDLNNTRSAVSRS